MQDSACDAACIGSLVPAAIAHVRGGTEKEWLAWLKRILAHNAAEFVRHYRGTGKRQVGKEIVRVFDPD